MMSGYTDGRAYAARWLVTDHRAVGNTARAYAVLSRARWSGMSGRYFKGFCLGVARECRDNLHLDTPTATGIGG